MAAAYVHVGELSNEAPGDPHGDGSSAALAAAGQLVAGVAHDVNNLVTVIKLHAELLEAEADLEGHALERLHAIRTQAERAVSLAWQVMDTAHRQPLGLEDVDVVAFLDDFREVIGRLLPPGVSLMVGSDPGRHVVRADACRLQQIMTNLVANATQALRGGGDLAISVHVEEGWSRIDVADTGEGMGAEVLARVFEPFFSTKPAGMGSGLGLTQVRTLVAQHDGRVAIRSEPGAGTVVSVWLPAAGASLPASQRHADAGVGRVPRGEGEIILVVEDDPPLRTALVDALDWLGYRPDAVADGDDALCWLGRPAARVDAVVSDVAMPGLGGEGLARRMAVAFPSIPIVLTTGAPWVAPGPSDPAPSNLQRVFRLPKPYSIEQLGRILDSALR